jgi:hypothetical protein
MACEVDKGIVINQGHSQWVDFYMGLKQKMNKVDII